MPIKDIEMHEFVAAWGPASVKNDIWVGLRKKIHLQVFDTDPSLFQPLQEDWLEEFAYTDGIRFNKGINDKFIRMSNISKRSGI